MLTGLLVFIGLIAFSFFFFWACCWIGGWSEKRTTEIIDEEGK